MKRLVMKIIGLFFFIAMAGHVQAQETLRGKVIDGQSGVPLAGATVLVKGSGDGASADEEGRFSLAISPGAALRISFIGYRPIEIRTDTVSIGEELLIHLFPKSAMLDELVVTGPAVPVELRVPAPIMTLGREDIQRYNDISLAPLLNQVTGLYMHSGTLNTNRITIRGVGNRSPFATAKIRAFLDDIPLTSGSGETTIEDIDMTILDQIQVWKGPTAGIYGAGLGGMIHLKSRKLESGAPSFLNLSGLAGSYGLLRSVAHFGYQNQTGESSRWSLNLNVNQTHSDGYRENNQYDRISTTAFSRIEPADGSETSILVNLVRLKSFIPSSLNLQDYIENPRRAAPTWAAIMGFEDYDKALVGLSHRRKLLSTETGLTLDNQTSLFGTWREAYEPRPFNILEEQSLSFGGRTTFEVKTPLSGQTVAEFALGLELFQENYDWQTRHNATDTLLSDDRERRSFYNFFAEARLKPGTRWEIVAGANLNRTRYDSEDRFLQDGDDRSGDYVFNTTLSPRLAGVYRISPASSLFASISHGFSPPTLEETLAPEGGINPDIQPEKGWNFELGSRGKYLGNRFSYELTVFTMYVRDLLVARRTALDQYVGINAGSTVHRGVEAYGHYQMIRQERFNVNVYAAYTFADYRFDEFIDGESDFSGNKLTGASPHLLNAGIDLNPGSKGLYGNLNFQFVDAMPVRDDNAVFSSAYRLLNLRLGYRFSIGKRWNLDAYGGINNIWNEKYASMIQINAAGFGAAPRYYYPGLPRHFFAGFSVNLSL